jgi:hypothetical protein
VVKQSTLQENFICVNVHIEKNGIYAILQAIQNIKEIKNVITEKLIRYEKNTGRNGHFSKTRQLFSIHKEWYCDKRVVTDLGNDDFSVT